MDENIYEAAVQILEVIPEWNLEEISKKLCQCKDVENRIDHVINEKLNENRKRYSDSTTCDDEAQSKKSRLSSDDLGSFNYSEDSVISLCSSSLDSPQQMEGGFCPFVNDDSTNLSHRPDIQEPNVSDNMITMLTRMFPDVDVEHIKYLKYTAEKCIAVESSVFDHVVTQILSEDRTNATIGVESGDSGEKSLIENGRASVPETNAMNPLFPETDIVSHSPIQIGRFSLTKLAEDTSMKVSALNHLPTDNSTTSVDSDPWSGVPIKEEMPICDIVEVKENGELKVVQAKNMSANEELVRVLMPIFPDACPKFLRTLCIGKTNDPQTVDNLLTVLLQGNVPQRERIEPAIEEPLDLEEQYNLMVEVLPDADPSYLRYHCQQLINNPAELKNFVDQLIETRSYPTLRDYKRKEQLSAQLRQYTIDFNVEKFLELFPNPEQYFENSTKALCRQNINYCLKRTIITDRFKNLFPLNRLAEITFVLEKNKYKVFESYKILRDSKDVMKRCRKIGPENPLVGDTDIPLLQELAYVTHIVDIKKFLRNREMVKAQEFALAKEKGLLLECGCCYDSEVMAEDASACAEGHLFCNECIVKSVEIGISENKTTASCLSNCVAEFPLTTLQKILKPKLFSKYALRKQLEEVKAAGIQELESCPFCEFATIPVSDDKIFKCLNDECMRESCRLCHEPSHIPFRCEEVEKSADVKARTYIENKMTEALLRKCWKCGMKFIKEEGCNKMTCSCGASMCYVCGEPVTDYSHFNGQGGTQIHLCPLYSDTNKLHLEGVRKVAEQAKEEIKQQIPDAQLKFDPLTGVPPPPKEDKIYKPGRYYDPLADAARIHRLLNAIGNFPVYPRDNQQAANNVRRHNAPRQPPAATFIPPRR